MADNNSTGSNTSSEAAGTPPPSPFLPVLRNASLTRLFSCLQDKYYPLDSSGYVYDRDWLNSSHADLVSRCDAFVATCTMPTYLSSLTTTQVLRRTTFVSTPLPPSAIMSPTALPAQTWKPILRFFISTSSCPDTSPAR